MNFIETYFYNDVSQIPLYLIAFAFGLMLLVVAIYFHELGHKLWFRLVKKRKIKINFIYNNWRSFHWEAGQTEDYTDLTDKEYSNMLIMGIAMGCIPIIIAAYIFFPFLLMLVPYIAGSWKDLKTILEQSKIED